MGKRKVAPASTMAETMEVDLNTLTVEELEEALASKKQHCKDIRQNGEALFVESGGVKWLEGIRSYIKATTTAVDQSELMFDFFDAYKQHVANYTLHFTDEDIIIKTKKGLNDMRQLSHKLHIANPATFAFRDELEALQEEMKENLAKASKVHSRAKAVKAMTTEPLATTTDPKRKRAEDDTNAAGTLSKKQKKKLEKAKKSTRPPTFGTQ